MGQALHKQPTFPYRHAVITGASAGIGAATAVRLSSIPGMHLTLIARSAAKLAAVEAACKANGAAVQVFAVDVADKAAMAQAITQANKQCQIDLVLANAGIMATVPPTPAAGAIEEEESSLGSMLWSAANTNIMGTLNTLAPALKFLKATAAAGRPAAVAIMSSILALPPKIVPFMGQQQVGMLPYGWSKHALLMLGEGLKGELAGTGVAVFTICPGVVLTDMADSLTTTLAVGMRGAKPPTGPAAAQAASKPQEEQVADSQALMKGSSCNGGDGALPAPDNGASAAEVDAAALVSSAGGVDTGAGDSPALGDGAASLADSRQARLKSRAGALTAQEAAEKIYAGLAHGKGGVVAFPAADVMMVKLLGMVSDIFLGVALKHGLARIASCDTTGQAGH